VVDLADSNLHVVAYSIPIHEKLSSDELKEHVFSLPDHPEWIPYRTSYYEPSWGLCVAHNELLGLVDDEYEVCIDATLADGHLTYGELVLPGRRADEVLISAHSCHPSLANDNLSGVAIATFLARELASRSHRYSYRFLFAPGTIGSITWLCLNEELTPRIKHGLVLACLGDPGHSTYKKSRRGNAEIDLAAVHVLRQSGAYHEILEFEPYGYDERQFCSPGFNMPVGCFMRTPYGRYPEYHTSADDLSFIHPEYLADSFAKVLATLEVLEGNRIYRNRNPKGEPQLGKRGLYRSLGAGGMDRASKELAMLWILNLSDGSHSLLKIAERSNLPFELIREAADLLTDNNLLEEMTDGG
jgi:aminopeptidase-like protein